MSLDVYSKPKDVQKVEKSSKYVIIVDTIFGGIISFRNYLKDVSFIIRIFAAF